MDPILQDLSDRLDKIEREMAADKAKKKARAPEPDTSELTRGELRTIECLRGAGKTADRAAQIVFARRGTAPALSNILRR